jgi:pimeloyl-ACP methyl ester carboxylesterase
LIFTSFIWQILLGSESLNLSMTQTAFLTYRSSQLHYCWFGAGQKTVLCLHGYGESEQSFHFLEKHLSRDYTVIALDLPFHGKTQWQEGLTFSTADLLAITEALLAKHAAGTDRITLLGFSMGGRVN